MLHDRVHEDYVHEDMTQQLALSSHHMHLGQTLSFCFIH